MILEMIRLYDKRRTRFAELAWKGHRYEIAPSHRHSIDPAKSPSAASMKRIKSGSSRSASAITLDWRRHSSAKPGARESGAQI